MKKYLLIGGPDYYPVGGTHEWIDVYATREEAESHAQRLIKDAIEWYEIVDLEKWMTGQTKNKNRG